MTSGDDGVAEDDRSAREVLEQPHARAEQDRGHVDGELVEEPGVEALLDGVGAGLIGIATAIAVERILSGTGRFNVGLAVVGTIQGIGASSSNIVAGWLTDLGGYRLAYWFHGGIALIAVIVFLLWRHDIAPPQPGDGKPVSEPNPAPALP